MPGWIRFVSFLVGAIALVLGGGSHAAAAVTPEQRAKIQQMTELTREASELYAAEEYVQTAAKLEEVQKQLVELMRAGSEPALQRLVKPIYRRVANAHSLLEIQGAQLEPLPPWEDLIKGMPESSTPIGVSFTKEIVPWLVASCGNCHIDNQRGQFSMVTYDDLMKGPPAGRVIFAGSATGNRFVEVIESGDMPRGGGRVSPEQLTVLKQWIVEGAKFDGPDPAVPLSLLAGSDSAASAPTPMTASIPTGQETVSFSRDIAPVLMANCNGCHINGRQASGNLRMDTFAQLLRGGDSGDLFVKNAPRESLLVKKLRGMAGQRMPAGGRPALAEETITLIENWIREGATFDGPTPTTNIEVVANRAWAAGATHEELFQRRRVQADQYWKRILPNAEPELVQSTETIVMGNIPPARLKTISDALDAARKKVQEHFNAPQDKPLIRGGVVAFVVKNRYEYSEFGRMIESRELPKEWVAHWRTTPVDVYVGLNSGVELTEDLLPSVALQITAGAYVASFDGVPYWFAEGVARNLVATHYRRSDPRIRIWQAAVPAAGLQVRNASELLQGQLDEEVAGTVGMALTNFMMERNNRRRFDKLMALLREGKNFNEAVTTSYAPPEILVNSWLGK